MNNLGITLFFVYAILIGCNSSPSPISYYEDDCFACKMIISDTRFGAELITKKGKVYKFDAVECMIPVIKKNGIDLYSHILVTDYNHPRQLKDALECQYLMSTSRPSPMGGYLSAYHSNNEAQSAYNQLGGILYNWTQLLEKDSQ